MAESKGTIIVTGAGQGIGAAIATQAALDDYRVCVNYLNNDESAAQVLASIEASGGIGIMVAADVGDESACSRICEQRQDKLKQIKSELTKMLREKNIRHNTTNDCQQKVTIFHCRILVSTSVFRCTEEVQRYIRLITDNPAVVRLAGHVEKTPCRHDRDTPVRKRGRRTT